MSHSGGVLCQRLGATEAYGKAEQTQLVEECESFFFSSYEFQGNHGTRRTALGTVQPKLQTIFGFQQAEVMDFEYLGVLAKKMGDLFGIGSLFFRCDSDGWWSLAQSDQ